MTTVAFILVIASLFSHAYWNYLIKSSRNKHAFTGLSKLAEIVIFAIPALFFLSSSLLKVEYLVLVLVASGITFMNYYFLSNAYTHGDLTLIYPISRSSVIFLPLLAFIFIGELIDSIGSIAISLVIIGTFVMHLKGFDRASFKSILNRLNNRGTLFALLAALAVAGYTLWDKVSISKMQPFLYFYFYTCFIGLFYCVFNLMKYGYAEIKSEWRLNSQKIIKVGFLNSITYIMVLTALEMSKATYIGGLRQLSIVVGAYFGYRFLGEQLSRPMIAGMLISVSGAILIYLAN